MDNNYIQWLTNHSHEFDDNGYCNLCGFHKDELTHNSGVINQINYNDIEGITYE